MLVWSGCEEAPVLTCYSESCAETPFNKLMPLVVATGESPSYWVKCSAGKNGIAVQNPLSLAAEREKSFFQVYF